jgi:hypothetical protein
MAGRQRDGLLANLRVYLCTPADAECICSARVPTSRPWSPSEVHSPPWFARHERMQRPQAPPKRPDFVAVRGAAATSRRNPLHPLDSETGQCIPCARLVSGGVMKCVACGAGMRLMQVETDTVTVCGIERHIFRCSACPQGAQRLMFNRARMSSINLPDAAAARPEPPAIKLQAARVAPPSGWTKAIEKLSSRQTALKERKPTDRISNRLSALKATKSAPIALRTKPAAARSSTWTNAIEKLRRRQIVLERTATARTNGTAGAFNRMWDDLRRDATMGAQLALPTRPEPHEF